MRFPGFAGEWKRHKLSEICSFYSGGTPSSSKKEYYNGDIPFIRSGELHNDNTELFITEDGLNNSAAKMVEVGDLLLALYGATSGDIAISKIKGAINQAILCIRTKQNKKFIESVWNKHVERLLQTYLQGGQGNLSADIVKNIPFYFASCAEQDKLAQFVSLLDERIAVQSRIIEKYESLIRGIVDLAFNHVATSNALGCYITQISQRNKNGKDLPVNKHGFVEQSEQFEDRIIASDDTSNYKIVNINDFAYNPARINVGSIARLKNKKCGIVSPMYICFRTLGNIIPEYLELFFKTKQFSFEVNKRLEGSVRLCLQYEGLREIAIPVLPVEKQQIWVTKITALYDKLAIEKGLQNNYHEQKQFLLSLMFI